LKFAFSSGCSLAPLRAPFTKNESNFARLVQFNSLNVCAHAQVPVFVRMTSMHLSLRTWVIARELFEYAFRLYLFITVYNGPS